MTDPKEDLIDGSGGSDPGTGPAESTNGTDKPGTDTGTDSGNNDPGTGSDTGNNGTGTGNNGTGTGSDGSGANGSGGSDGDNRLSNGGVEPPGQLGGDTGTGTGGTGTARRRNSGGSRKRNNRPNDDGAGEGTDKTGDTPGLAQTLVVTQADPGTPPRGAKLSKKAGKLADDMDKVVAGAFHITSMFRGPHWKVKPEESKMIAEPMAEIMSELSPGFGKTIQKITMPLALVGALVTVMAPRIVLDLEVKNYERSKAALANSGQGSPAARPESNIQRTQVIGPAITDATGGGDVTLVTQSIANLFNEGD